MMQGRTTVALLAGGDKRTRNRDIETAPRLARNLQVDAMTKTVTSPYDVAEHLRTPEEMAAYLEASIEEAAGDAAFIAKALGDIARAKGMSQVACDAGLSRESLYKALSGERNPTLDTVLRVVGALGLKLRARSGARSGRGRTGRIDTSLMSRTNFGHVSFRVRRPTPQRTTITLQALKRGSSSRPFALA